MSPNYGKPSLSGSSGRNLAQQLTASKKKKLNVSEKKTNGKIDWPDVTKSLEEETENLKQQLSLLQNQYQEQSKRFKALEKVSLDERAAVKVRILNLLHGRLINFQAHCADDKQSIETMLEEVRPVLKAEIALASKPK